jgi:hypothetical protein
MRVRKTDTIAIKDEVIHTNKECRLLGLPLHAEPRIQLGYKSIFLLGCLI